jgi:hypothetical protein
MNFDRKLYFLLVVVFYYLGVIYFSLNFGNFLFLVWGAAPFLSVIAVLRESKYYMEIYFVILTILVIVSGFVLSYVYIFMPKYTSSVEYYLSMTAFLLYLIFLIYGLIYREKI